ncbi:MAG: hypothetical protein FJZ58_01950 [Chlamydiae bacterium]|nr:hypothetical protein [Chlamydiota bacterium]
MVSRIPPHRPFLSSSPPSNSEKQSRQHHSLSAFQKAYLEQKHIERVGPIDNTLKEKIQKKEPISPKELEVLEAHIHYKLQRSIPLQPIEQRALWAYAHLRVSHGIVFLQMQAKIASLDAIRRHLIRSQDTSLTTEEENIFVQAKYSLHIPLTKYEQFIYDSFFGITTESPPSSPAQPQLPHPLLPSFLVDTSEKVLAFFAFIKKCLQDLLPSHTETVPKEPTSPSLLLQGTCMIFKNLLYPIAALESYFTNSAEELYSSVEDTAELFNHLIEQNSPEAILFQALVPCLTPTGDYTTCDLTQELFSGANFQVKDKGAFYNAWSKLPGVRDRISSHDSKESKTKGLFLHSLGGEFLFWIDHSDPGHPKTCFQLERSTLIFSSLRVFRHTIDFFHYKMTGLQQGPLGTSIHTDKNPITFTVKIPTYPSTISTDILAHNIFNG